MNLEIESDSIDSLHGRFSDPDDGDSNSPRVDVLTKAVWPIAHRPMRAISCGIEVIIPMLLRRIYISKSNVK